MVRAWVKLIWNAAVVAAVAVAAQLGVADVLGIIRWDNDGGPLSAAMWSSLLTWIGFSYTVAVLTGATAGRRALPRADDREGIGARVTASLAAVLGAGVAIAVAWLPARGVTPPVRVHADLVIAITAGAGALIGLVFALIALSSGAVAAGLRTTVTWIWLVGIGSAAAGMLSHEAYPAPRLGVIDAPSLIPAAWWSGPRVMIAVAAVLGLIVALIARVYGSGRISIALSGFGGPAIVAGAYLLAGPGIGADRSWQYDPYVASLIATGVGLFVSVIVAMPARPAPRSDREDHDLGPISGDLVATGSGRSSYAFLDSTTSGQGFPSVPQQPSFVPGFGREEQSSSSLGLREPLLPPFPREQGIPREPAFPREPGAAFASEAFASEPLFSREPAPSRESSWHSASTETELPPVTPRHSSQEYSGGSTYSSAALYPGGTHASPLSEPPPPPMMGQPPEDDLHSTWLRELGSTGTTGRHSR